MSEWTHTGASGGPAHQKSRSEIETYFELAQALGWPSRLTKNLARRLKLITPRVSAQVGQRRLTKNLARRLKHLCHLLFSAQPRKPAHQKSRSEIETPSSRSASICSISSRLTKNLARRLKRSGRPRGHPAPTQPAHQKSRSEIETSCRPR